MTRTTTTHRTHRRTWAALAAGVALAVAGCSASASAEGGDEPAAIATYAGAEVAFGESFTYGNGLVVEVRKPVTFTPSETADGVEGVDGTPVRLRVNVINGSSQDFVPDGIGVTLESGGEEAPQILDPGQRIELTGPQRTLTRGDVAAFDLAFVVADPDDLTVTLVPALAGYDPLVVTAP